MELLEESLNQLAIFLDELTPFLNSPEKGATSVLMEEMELLAWGPATVKTFRPTPIIQKLSAVNAFIQLFISLCRASQGIYNVCVLCVCVYYVSVCVCICMCVVCLYIHVCTECVCFTLNSVILHVQT